MTTFAPVLLIAVLAGLSAASASDEPPREPSPSPGAEEPITAPDTARTGDGRALPRPEKTKHVAPEYPDNAREAGLVGPVELECTVDVSGRVSDVKVLKGFRSLAAAATEAVRKWRYAPLVLDGRPVPFIITVTVNYRLQGVPFGDGVVRSLRDRDPEIRWAAIQWLGRYCPVVPKQRKALERAMKDAEPAVREAAVKALAGLCPRTLNR